MEENAGKVEGEESESGSHLKQLGSFSVTVGNQGANRRGSTFLASCTNQVLKFRIFYLYLSKRFLRIQKQSAASVSKDMCI